MFIIGVIIMESKNSILPVEIEETAASLDIEKIKNIIKSENVNDIKTYAVLLEKGRMTRTKLMKETGIARSTLYDALVRLMNKKLVYLYSEAAGYLGRPKVYFALQE